MRHAGLLDSPRALGPDGHGCWGYDDLGGDFLEAAVAFLEEGRELGQALMFVGGPESEAVVRSTEPLASMVADGTLRVVPFDAVYPDGRRLPHADQWATYAATTEQAMAAGATGLRVLAEVTSLVRSHGWEGQALWETYADRRMADWSLSALCCFDRGMVAPDDLGRIACAHPVADRRLADSVPFRLYGDGGAIAITGEIDAFSSHTLRQLLRVDDPVDGDRILDLEGLTFIEHTGVRALHAYAEDVRAQGRSLTVRGGPRSLQRIAAVLGVAI